LARIDVTLDAVFRASCASSDSREYPSECGSGTRGEQHGRKRFHMGLTLRKNRLTGIGASLLLLGLVATIAVVTQSRARSDDFGAIVQATQAYMAKQTAPGIQPAVTAVSISGGYALAAWHVPNSGGEAILKLQANNSWLVVVSGGGVWRADELTRYHGIPSATATALVNGFVALPTPTPEPTGHPCHCCNLPANATNAQRQAAGCPLIATTPKPTPQ